MNLEDIIMIFRNTGWIKNEHSFKRYIRLMSYYKKLNLQKKNFGKGEIEAHHILPEKLWHEYRREQWNIVNLPARAHVIAHYLLYKSIDRPECVYAFNQMNRVSKKTGKLNSKLYANCRKELAELVSKLNTGRKWKTEQYAKHTENHKGKNTYRHIVTGIHKKFVVGEQPDGWEPFQTNRVKKEESKNKLGIAMAGRKWQYNPSTKEVKFDSILHPNFVEGYPEWFDNNSQVFKVYKWAYSEYTGEVVRCLPDNIPEGYIVGRNYNNRGFEKINNSDYVRMLDVINKTYTLVHKDHLPNPRYVQHGMPVKDIFVITYNNNTFYSWKDLEQAHPELPKLPSPKNETIMDKLIPKKHFNQTCERQIFCEQHSGKTFRNVGLIIKRLIEE